MSLCTPHVLRDQAIIISLVVSHARTLAKQTVAVLGPVSRKSRNFSGVFRVTQFSLYLQNEGVSRHETLQLFLFLFPLQHMKRQALQNKQVIVLRLAFRARKVLGTFEKRAPGNSTSELILTKRILSTPNTECSKDYS